MSRKFSKHATDSLGLILAELRSTLKDHGIEAIEYAVSRLTENKRGRRPEEDWPLLQEYIDEDVKDWLSGNDPIALRSNYSVALAFAKKYPGHSELSTSKRIMSKLVKERRKNFLWKSVSNKIYQTFIQYINTLGELAKEKNSFYYHTAKVILEKYQELRNDNVPIIDGMMISEMGFLDYLHFSANERPLELLLASAAYGQDAMITASPQDVVG